MFTRTISRAEARRVYDTLGIGLDRAARYEAQAGARALVALELQPGQRVLQTGVGTGGAHLTIAQAVAPDGHAFGLDLSHVMLRLTRGRCAAPLVGDATALPFAARSFDRLYCAYLLDLLPADDLPRALAEFARVLRPTGRLALVSLTEGVDRASRLFVAAWKLRFLFAPQSLGGCRPLRLGPMVESAGFVVERREIIVQRGLPSEIVVATLPTVLGRGWGGRERPRYQGGDHRRRAVGAGAELAPPGPRLRSSRARTGLIAAHSIQLRGVAVILRVLLPGAGVATQRAFAHLPDPGGRCGLPDLDHRGAGTARLGRHTLCNLAHRHGAPRMLRSP